jgi:putative PIN family toxin of toxin-antitoxin system
MTSRRRVVLDTNVLISRLLAPRAAAARAVHLATGSDSVLASAATLMELADVLSRPKFDPYVSIQERQTFLRMFARLAEHVAISRPIRACRDPKDDKFLELAVNGDAGLIVTGDAELLGLHPFHAIAILTPSAFLALAPMPP